MNLMKSFISIFSLVLVICVGMACKKPGAEVKSEETVTETEKTINYDEISLDPAAFGTEIKKGNAVVIDLGYPTDYEQAHIDGAININFFEEGFQEKILLLEKDKKYYLYSKNEALTKRTAAHMKQNGFAEVYFLKGGWEAWQQSEQK